MSIEWKIGDIINGKESDYTLSKDIGGGAQSTFKATDSSEKDVFLKIYADEPRKSNKRFDVFYLQQQEIYKRLEEITEITEILYEDFLVDDQLSQSNQKSSQNPGSSWCLYFIAISKAK